jgi:hypothetical protein
MEKEVKNGFLTSEFALSLSGLIMATILLWGGKISVDLWSIIFAAVIPGYAISRGLAKK